MPDFDADFDILTGNRPFPWQRALYERLVSGAVPATCDIPTGLGKTSVIAVWLLARAAGAPLPRRLVYVVNRRTVVDQTTEEVHRLRSRCHDAGIVDELSLSTLRGQMADNRAWSADPSKPAVICGTVDMIGSRLLFSGYRIGFRAKPLHAGFLGQDSLLVHDEAHLEPAFQRLLDAIVAEQRRCSDPWPLSVMALTATSREGASSFRLGPEDEEHPVVSRRLRATKRLSLHPCGEQGLATVAVEHALAYRDSKRAVVVFLRTVDDVAAVVAALRKAGHQVQQLTGTMRGFERDRLVASNEVFARFLRPNEAAGETVYLVCTSAGEVGVNLSADHLISDLSTFDSMAQRFGRLNRFGLRDDSEARVLHPNEELLQSDKARDAPNRLATLALLRQLEGDASPKALGSLDPEARRRAFAPAPEMLEATDILFDRWASTTIPDPLAGRPPVAPYLHGIEEWEPPTTQVAWRREVDWIKGDLLAKHPAQDLLDDYPLKPHEILTDRTSRIVETLVRIAAARPAPEAIPVWVVDDRGRVDDRVTLASLVEGDRRAVEDRLDGSTVLLPPSCCRPVGGLLSVDGIAHDGADDPDVADQWLGESGNPLRVRAAGVHAPPPGMRLVRTVTLLQDDDGEDPNDDGDGRFPEDASWSWYELPKTADTEGSRSATRPVLLSVHSADVEREARGIVERLGLAPDLAIAVVTAARLHDIGKERRVWQRSIGNMDRARVLAKSGGSMQPLDTTGYRHELGSIIDAQRKPLVDGLSAEQRELVLHLVAAHHGRARPHFPESELFDPEAGPIDVGEIGDQVVRRFADLQRRYGRWGLAYLESLVRAADYAASANPSRTEEEGQ